MRPQTSDTTPVLSVVFAKIDPSTDPKAMKPPSTQKNAISRITKFFTLIASLKLGKNSVYFGFYIATKLGGFEGLSLIRKNKGTVTQVIQQFYIKISLFSASFIYCIYDLLFKCAKIKPDIVKAKIFPIGIERPQTAVIRVRSESGNHLFGIKFIAPLNRG